LLKARDTGLPNDGYVCFRKNEDEFFVVWFSKPHFRRKWDSDLKQMVIDDEATAPGLGDASSYRDGVADSRVMPRMSFSGTWMPLGESGMFSSEKINGKKKDEKDQTTGIFIDENQFSLTYKYQNSTDKTVEYNLTIQRSTGRFTESFREESQHVPFSEGAGRCIFRK